MRIYCFKCHRVYEGKRRCVIHPQRNPYVIDGLERYIILHTIFSNRIIRNSNIILFINTCIILSFYLLCALWLTIISSDDIVLITNPNEMWILLLGYLSRVRISDLWFLLMIIGILHLPIILHVCFVLLFPCWYIVVLLPALKISETIFGLSDKNPFSPVLKGKLARQAKFYLKIYLISFSTS